MPVSEPHITVQGLRVAYGANEVLKGIDLSIQRGSFVALLGPSGCGKTTLLRTLSGFTPSCAGSISVNGRDIAHEPPERRDMAMVFQSYALWSHMNVAQNMGYGLKLRKMPRADIARRIGSLLDMLGLQGYADRPVTELSGGQRQRVALGRALAVEPQILLLDEPLSNLDARIRLQMRHEIRAIQRKLGVTAVLVTHDREEAMVMADQVVILDQGQIAQIGTPEEVFQHPKTPYVASFMGAENIIHCEAEVSHAGVHLSVPGLPGASIRCQAALPTSGPAQVHFRSEAARLQMPGEPAQDSLQLPGRVTQVSYLGGGYRCEIQTHCGPFFIDHHQSVAHNQTVAVHVPADALHVYPREVSRQTLAQH
ncbi:ABC transporter ATP-binding protein [Rhodoferax sp. U11-2br]|uniref:ABC transporter ATP-binding protein n=1 Tax=Rhodoferax sp. U11-2br TaxID=2838878 RepID=UPI001BEA0BA6|nr:ABC transporter ATP-binding protein [Rhodoferax sp. U11-2br]MBT3068877.1 ABC transporter ATP-binding protein [Rhodoferax sp. U11-2br]